MAKIRIALTGAPATGKTSICHKLEEMGYDVFHEVARDIIADSLERGSDVVPWDNLDAFSALVWERRMEDYNSAAAEFSFYDRTVLDTLSYLFKDDVPVRPNWAMDMETVQFDKIFLLPVWEEIHSLDSERMETLEDCIEVERCLLETHKNYGYDVVIVPKLSIEERIQFIIEELKKSY